MPGSHKKTAKAKVAHPKSKKTSILFYPALTFPVIKNPNRLYAFPILGGFVKCIFLIPVFVWLMVLGIAFFFMTVLINPFVVLFSGTYWQSAYEVTSLLIRLSAKTQYFFWGLTNTYPTFDGKTKDFTLIITYPDKPNRFFAFPILGGFARMILLIPFLCFVAVIQYAGNFAAIIASFPVLFMGKYPESLFQLQQDSIRLNLSSMMYFAGLSDSYPSFWISMKHKVIKIIFIVLAILWFLNGLTNTVTQNNYSQNSSNYSQYQTPSGNY